MKVALVFDDSLDRNDGVQQYVKSLGGWLTAEGHSVHYLVGQSTQRTNQTIHSLSHNVRVRFNKNRLSIPLPANKMAIKQLLLTENYDVLHVQMPYSPFMAGKVISAAPAGTAVVGTFHILPFGRLQRSASKALGVVQKRSLSRFNAICSVSPAAAAFANSHFGLETTIIPNLINLKAFSSAIHIHPKRIVFLGRLVPRKGCFELLKAIQLLCESKDLAHIEVLIGGTGPELKTLKSFCDKSDLSKVVFLGYVDENKKADLLASAEIAVFPSLGGESFGIVLLEAMAAGSGVVLGGNNAGYASVLAECPEALFDPKNTSAFAEILHKYLTKTAPALTLHAQQQKMVLQYDTAVVGKQIVEMYQTALQHAKSMR